MILKITLAETLNDNQLQQLEEIGFTKSMDLYVSVLSCLKYNDRLEYQLAPVGNLFFDEVEITSFVSSDGANSIGLYIGDTLYEFKVNIAIANGFPSPDRWTPQ